MSLDEFGGGVPIDQPNKEDRDNVELSRWLAGPDVDVYWDRTKSYGLGTFTTDLACTPDLVVDGNNRTYAIEVKPPDESTKIHEGVHQAKGYWKDVESGRATYRLGNDKAEIDAVLVATRNSPSGHLFENQRKSDPRRPARSRGGSKVARKGHMPEVEHAGTQQTIRQAYRDVRRWYEESEKDSADTGFGYLASLCLDAESPGLHSTPAAFYLKPGNGSKSHNWQSIPWHKKDG
jgi:hypothetical protein